LSRLASFFIHPQEFEMTNATHPSEALMDITAALSAVHGLVVGKLRHAHHPA
jgi:hypothetical protein